MPDIWMSSSSERPLSSFPESPLTPASDPPVTPERWLPPPPVRSMANVLSIREGAGAGLFVAGEAASIDDAPLIDSRMKSSLSGASPIPLSAKITSAISEVPPATLPMDGIERPEGLLDPLAITSAGASLRTIVWDALRMSEASVEKIDSSISKASAGAISSRRMSSASMPLSVGVAGGGEWLGVESATGIATSDMPSTSSERLSACELSAVAEAHRSTSSGLNLCVAPSRMEKSFLRSTRMLTASTLTPSCRAVSSSDRNFPAMDSFQP